MLCFIIEGKGNGGMGCVVSRLEYFCERKMKLSIY